MRGGRARSGGTNWVIRIHWGPFAFAEPPSAAGMRPVIMVQESPQSDPVPTVAPPTILPGWSRRLLTRLELDRAVVFALLLRLWQLLAGAVSVVLIALFFTGEMQGYYYTFAGLLALQSFFELGLHIVIISTASHEWARLRFDSRGRIVGDADARSRLIHLGHWMAAWYGMAALLFIAVVSMAGVVFFSLRPAGEVAWFWPWMLLVLLTGMLLGTLPLVALLEGCNQVATVNRFRLIQAVAANLAVWTAISLGGGLWSAVVAAGARLAIDLYLILVHYGHFFRQLLERPGGARIGWRTELWPMQWRLGLGGVFSYFEFSLYTPILFHYHGPVIAGQMGMSWTLLIAVQAAALAWVQTRAPRFGVLISQRNYQQLDHLFFRLTTISLVALSAVCLAAWSLVLGMYVAEFRLAARLLPPLPLGLFFLAFVLNHIPRCQEIYLRAHKREPVFAINLVSSSLTGLLVWLLGAAYGAEGAAMSYLAVVACVSLPAKTWLWQACRRKWHV